MTVKTISLCRLLTLFSFFISTPVIDGALFLQAASAPWETGGGDIFALKFVKIGRAFGDEMSKGGAACAPLRRFVDPAQFLQAVDQVHISSVNGTPQYFPHSIQFNRRMWYNSSKSEKLREVFRGYSVLATAKLPQVSSESINRCLPSSIVAKTFGTLDENLQDSPQTFAKDFHQANLELGQIIAQHSKELNSWSIPTSRLLEVVELANQNRLELTSSSLPLHFKSGEIKDGRNSKSGDSLFLSLNEPIWTRVDQTQRVELLFHEYLGLADVDDSFYQYSSRLWKMVPSQHYKEL